MKKNNAAILLLLWGMCLFQINCVPIRQMVYPDSQPASQAGSQKTVAPSSKSQTSSSISSKDPDAWKSEMEGIASWYGADFNGRLTANGEVYDMYAYTAAHKTLPLGTVVKVTNVESGQTVEVRINDRGPYVKGRIIDLSRTAGRAIGIREEGTAKVKLEIVRWPASKN